MASSITADLEAAPPASVRPAPTPAAMAYGLSVLLVAVGVIVAFVVDHLVPTPNLSLVFVLPVILAAVSFGWGPALVAAVLGVAAFDFFFVEPHGSLQVDNPADLWAMALLLVVAAITSTVAAESRRRALAARRAADQAQALHGLAHAIIRAEPPRALMQTAADTLAGIFNTAAVILTEDTGALEPSAMSRVATLSAADREAAQWALANGKPTRAETYPFDQAQFDFWPVTTPAHRRLVLGVRLADAQDGRPADPERHVELVAGYLAAASV
jgi:two-component system sensor histidine kinase KdpD